MSCVEVSVQEDEHVYTVCLYVERNALTAHAVERAQDWRWPLPPPIAILCSENNDAVVEYATGDIRAKVFASKYLTNLPDKETLRQEILKTQRALTAHVAAKGES